MDRWGAFGKGFLGALVASLLVLGAVRLYQTDQLTRALVGAVNQLRADVNALQGVPR